MDSWPIFVSYSRQDRDIVSPFIKLMKIGAPRIFKDDEVIALGKKWQLVIVEALNNCKTLVVFWTRNAASSEAVREEYLTAIRRDIDVAPVLLDATPLAKELLEYEFADFRQFVRVKKPMSPIVWIIIILAIIVAIVVIACTRSWATWLLPFCLLGMVQSTAKSPRERSEETNASIYRTLYERIIRDRTAP